MKIGIAVNHSYPHIGGSEKVIQEISERLVANYSDDVYVFSYTSKKKFEYNGVNYIPIPSDVGSYFKLLSSLNLYHLFVYSDYFLMWPYICRNPSHLNMKKSIALVGMNRMLSNKDILSQFIKNKNSFSVITHSSNYQDYEQCKKVGIDVTVIPNGVDVKEFQESTNDFREKYDISKNKIIVLCVSNFFPGKGQEYLVDILDDVFDKIGDYFCVIFISSSVNYAGAKKLSDLCKIRLKNKKYDYKFLENISRDDTISAFNCAKLFLFPSQKEVSPIVLLEAQASQTPWISFDVGNTYDLDGGISISCQKNKNGNCIIGDIEKRKFSNMIVDVLYVKDLYDKLKSSGHRQVSEGGQFNWNSIVEKYRELFSR